MCIRKFIFFQKAMQLGFVETVISPEIFSMKPKMSLVSLLNIVDICIIVTLVEFLMHSLKA